MRSIILCAGMGSRLDPFTQSRHKALLPVKGEPLLERSIKYLHSHNITDITIVVGHCAEQFDYLKDKYGVELRLSTLYKTHNNYTSMQLVLDKMEDCFILEGDLYICDDFIPKIDKTKNQYLAQEITYGLEWGVVTDSNDRILEVKSNHSGWGLAGIFYWKGDFTEFLRTELPKCSQNDFWDNVLWRNLDSYPIYINKVEQGIALEFDKMEDILFHKAMTPQEIASWAIR